VIPAGQIFIIGDSHIGLADGSEAPIVTWLDRLAALHPRALYLNGDLFHYLIADPKFYTSSVEKVFARFRELRDSGVPIHYVEGNRDFFLHGSFVEDGVTDIAMEYTVAAGDNPRRHDQRSRSPLPLLALRVEERVVEIRAEVHPEEGGAELRRQHRAPAVGLELQTQVAAADRTDAGLRLLARRLHARGLRTFSREAGAGGFADDHGASAVVRDWRSDGD